MYIIDNYCIYSTNYNRYAYTTSSDCWIYIRVYIFLSIYYIKRMVFIYNYIIYRVNIDIFDNTLDLVDEIIKLNTRSLDGDDKKIKIDEFTKLFEPFSIKFKNFGENGVKPNDQTFVYFVYTYILLYCYKTAFIESQKTANIFSFDDWWFFSSNQFDNIKKELNFQIILNKFNELVNIEPSAFPPSSQESVEPVNNSPPPSVEPVSNSDVPSDVASAVPSVEPVNNSPPPSNETPAETPSAETPNELGNNL